MTAGDPVVATRNKQTVDSLSVPVPPKKKMKSSEDCAEMLETAFTTVTPSAVAVASADDDECRSSGSFISNKLRNYLPRTRNKVTHDISIITFAADLRHFDVSYPVPAPSLSIPGFLSHHSFLCCWFRRRKSL